MIVLVSLAVVHGGTEILGQDTLEYPRGEVVDYVIDSGINDNPSDKFVIVYSAVVHIDERLLRVCANRLLRPGVVGLRKRQRPLDDAEVLLRA